MSYKTVQCLTLSDLDKFVNDYFYLFNDKKIILLNGELGAGKTAFVKALAKKIGIKENITSPTFNYMKLYDGLAHVDLYNYRGSLDEFEDYWDDLIVAIEWSDLIEHQYQSYVRVDVKMNGDYHEYTITEVK
ncbi:tRNA (adenosine(37)-N6)-threonylcarbamoyltransferase complex ATPase subunit type 1 TsaE [Mycoplasma corogypsi]|uniref:tRNA (adenosine(37)-N6)-threonylcarbamoyltransferase complex ATPase subunit type 1 TsaE n=1 Tax=Mycoplasma corogypsi TaxID=2106 RepID=UPI003872E1FC